MKVRPGEEYELQLPSGLKQRLVIEATEELAVDPPNIYCWYYKAEVMEQIGIQHSHPSPRDFIEELVFDQYTSNDTIINFIEKVDTNLFVTRSVVDTPIKKGAEIWLLYDDSTRPRVFVGRYETKSLLVSNIIDKLKTKYLIHLLEKEFGIILAPVFIDQSFEKSSLTIKMSEDNVLIGYIYSTDDERTFDLGDDYSRENAFLDLEDKLDAYADDSGAIDFCLYEQVSIDSQDWSLIDNGQGYVGYDIEENGMIEEIGEQWLDAVKVSK